MSNVMGGFSPTPPYLTNPYAGKAIRIARKKARMNTQALAEKLGYSARMVCYLEAGERRVSMGLLPLLSEVLGIPESWFTNFHPENLWTMPMVLCLVETSIGAEDHTPFYRPEVEIHEGRYGAIHILTYADCESYAEALGVAYLKAEEALQYHGQVSR